MTSLNQAYKLYRENKKKEKMQLRNFYASLKKG